MKYAKIIETRGAQFPGGVERVYRLRSGRKGTGKILAEHRARGDDCADAAALVDMLNQATALGRVVASDAAAY